jgi:hypothetical protein
MGLSESGALANLRNMPSRSFRGVVHCNGKIGMGATREFLPGVFNARPAPSDDPISEQNGPPASAQQLTSLVKAEIWRAKQRDAIAGSDLLGFPVWEIALLVFEGHCEAQEVTVEQICAHVGRSVVLTMRFLRLMETQGLVCIAQGKADLSLPVTNTARLHASIADYLSLTA